MSNTIQSGIAGSIARTYQRGVVGPATAHNAYAGAMRQAAGRPRTDSVTLSSTTQELMKLREVVSSSPDIRSERVAALKAQIANGTYNTDPAALAARMLLG
jgi:negative regulator of flagellin synthesis FlgM